MTELKLFVGIPTTGKIRYELVEWLIRQNINTLYFSVDGFKDANANKIIHRFLKSDCTHLLLLDSDILPDEDLIKRLYGYDKDVVAGCPIIFNHFEKRFKIAAFRKINEKKYRNIGFSNKLEKVDVIGGACVFIKRKVLESMSPPWFKIILADNGIDKKGADTFFSEKCAENGFEVYADCTTPLGHKNDQDLLDILIAANEKKGKSKLN